MARDILIVDDEADIRMLIAGILKDEGYETREAGNSAQALTRDPRAPAVARRSSISGCRAASSTASRS